MWILNLSLSYISEWERWAGNIFIFFSPLYLSLTHSLQLAAFLQRSTAKSWAAKWPLNYRSAHGPSITYFKLNDARELFESFSEVSEFRVQSPAFPRRAELFINHASSFQYNMMATMMNSLSEQKSFQIGIEALER